MDLNDIGSVLHRMFEVSLTSYRADSQGASSSDEKEQIYQKYCSRDFREWAVELFSQVISESETPLSQDPAFLAASGNRILDVAAHSLHAIFEDISPHGFEPHKMEWHLGEDGTHPVSMKLPSGRTVRFRGMIDRIDVNRDESSFRIIDYKSGNKVVDYASLYYGLSVQLPAYLHAYSTKNPEWKPGDAGYFYLTAPMIPVKDLTGKPNAEFMSKEIRKTYSLRSLQLDSDGLRSAGEYALEKIEEHCRALFAGHFPVEPRLLPKKGGKAACEYCDFMSVCRIDPSRPPYKRLPPLPVQLDENGKKMTDKDVFRSCVGSQISQKGGEPE